MTDVDDDLAPDVTDKLQTARHEYQRLKAAKDELAARRDLIAILQPTGAKRISNLSEAACGAVIVALREALVTHLATIAPVLPIYKNGKKASINEWPKLATQDPKVLKQWVRERPGANWGWCTNAIDVDTKDPKPGKRRGSDVWAELVAEKGEPETFKTLTPSGGSHYLVSDKLPNTQGALGDGLDTRGEGIGYVVAPGSYVVADGENIRATGFYQAVAKPVASVPWIVARVGAQRPAAERGLEAEVELDTNAAISQAVDMLKSYAASEREEDRNGKQINGPAIQFEGGDGWTVQVAMNVGDLGISRETCLDLMFEHFNPACSPPWNGDDEGDVGNRLSTKVNSAYNSRQKPPGSDSAVADFADDPIEDDDADDFVREDKPKRKLPPTVSISELMTGTFLRTKYTVGDLVMQGVVNMFYGNGGTGKTTVAIQMATAVSAGRPLFERQTIKGPSLLVLAEDGLGEIKPRVEGALRDLDIKNTDDVDCEVWALPGEDISVARINEEGKTVLLPFYYELEKKLAAKPGLFVVLDSLADIAEMGEAGRVAANTFFKKVLGGLAVKHGATILVLGHPSKASMADGSYYSGSTAYRNSVRNMIVLKEIKDTDFRSLERLKNNYADAKARLTVAWSDGIFVTTENAVVTSAEMGRYRAVVNVIRELIGQGLDVANTNQASGQTPKDVAKAVNTLGVVKVSWREVADFMAQAERALDLKYVKGTNRRNAHYEIGNPADFEPGDTDEADELRTEFAGEVDDDLTL
jgi:hypothetical protein